MRENFRLLYYTLLGFFLIQAKISSTVMAPVNHPGESLRSTNFKGCASTTLPGLPRRYTHTYAYFYVVVAWAIYEAGFVGVKTRYYRWGPVWSDGDFFRGYPGVPKPNFYGTHGKVSSPIPRESLA